MTAESESVIASTLANGGTCPITGENVMKPDSVYNASARGHLILKYLGTLEFELLQCQTLILAGGRRVRMVRIAQVTPGWNTCTLITPNVNYSRNTCNLAIFLLNLQRADS